MSMLPIIKVSELKNYIQIDPQEQHFTDFILLSCSMEIEGYCKRILRERTILELHDGRFQKEIILNEYPVSEISSIWFDKNRIFNEYSRISEEFYSTTNRQFYTGDKSMTSIQLIDDLKFPVGRNVIKVEYTAGYNDETMPEDLKAAFLELVTWTLQRHKTKQIGVNGMINQQGRAVQNTFEKKMPLSVEEKLKPYRRSCLL